MLPMVYMALVDDEDLPAFEEMYERTHKKLYSIAFDILNDHQLAEDALSDLFLRLSLSFKKINNFSLHDLDAYLVRCIKNTCYNVINKNDAEKRKIDKLIKNSHIKSTAIDNSIFDKIELDLLKKVISSLPEPYMTALVLKEYYDLKADDIAKQMNISKRSVFYYVKAAKVMILQEIGGSDLNE